MPIRTVCALSTVLLALGTSRMPAYSQSPHSEASRSVVIVELFTSEGCSSCPPADALLQKVHLKQTSQQQLIVGISEHVTYWDRLGWKDPYSAEVFTERQNQYASRMQLDGPYTPQMVVNGRDQFVGSDAAALQSSLEKAAERPHVAFRILSSTKSSKDVDVQFTSTPFAKPLDIFAVITDDTDHTQVLRGENSGRSLAHVSVARSITRVAQIAAGSQPSQHVALSLNVHLGANTGHHLILFAQEPHQGAIVGADIVSF